MDINQLLSRPHVWLNGRIDDNMQDQLCRSLDAMYARADEKNPSTVTLVLTTTGGSYTYTQGLVQTIGLFKEVLPIHFLGLGTIASAGVRLMMEAFSKEERSITDRTQLFFHVSAPDRDVHFHGTLQSCQDLLATLKKDFDAERKQEDRLFELIAQASIKKLEEIRELATTGCTLTGQEAVTFGLVQSVIPLTRLPTLTPKLRSLHR